MIKAAALMIIRNRTITKFFFPNTLNIVTYINILLNALCLNDVLMEFNIKIHHECLFQVQNVIVSTCFSHPSLHTITYGLGWRSSTDPININHQYIKRQLSRNKTYFDTLFEKHRDDVMNFDVVEEAESYSSPLKKLRCLNH